MTAKIEQRWNDNGEESWCIISGDLIIGFGPGTPGKESAESVMARGDDPSGYNNCPEYTLTAWQNAAESLPATCVHKWVGGPDDATHCDLCGIFAPEESKDDEAENLTDEVCPNCGEEGVAYGDYYHATGKGWPDPKSVKAKEKNRLTYEETKQRFGLPVAEPKPTPSEPNDMQKQMAHDDGLITTLQEDTNRLRKERAEWQRKYFEISRALSGTIDKNGDLIKRIQWLEHEKDEIRNSRPQPDSSSIPEIELELRRMMWLGHGHTGMYGDDGEMQCMECRPFGVVDYKREPLDKVRETFRAVQMERMMKPRDSSSISTEFGFTVDELVGELHQCLHTIEFLYGCLESPNFRHEYPEQTRSRIEFLQKMLPNRGGCIHSHRKADCEWCIEGDRLRSLHQSVVEKIAAWNAAKGQRNGR